MPRKSNKDKKAIEHLLIQKQTELAALLAQNDILERDLERNLKIEMAHSAREDFKSFVAQSWEIIDPGAPFISSWYVDAICEHLVAVQKSQINNLIIQIPPRHSKSSLCSTLFPAWSWLQEPSEQFITASATQKLVLRDSIRSRNVIQSDWYTSTFAPEFEILRDQNQAGFYKNNKGGYRFATSVGGTLTGFGYSIGILDDILKADDAYSKTKIETTLQWWKESFLSRKNNPQARTIIIMQRLSDNDVIGYELSNNEDLWDNVCLPILYDPERKYFSSIGINDIRTKPGELLSPDRFPLKEVEVMRKRMGEVGFQAQYLQSPSPIEGNIVKKDWIKYFHQPINKFQLPMFELIIASWDLSFTSEGNSFCVGQVWGKKGSDKYLLHQVRDKMDIVQQLQAIRKMKQDYPSIRAMLVEKRANGDAVIRILQKEVPGLIAISPQEIGAGDKEVRLSACSIDFEAGSVYFPHHSFAPWILDLVSELTTFPRSKNDDQVDALSQALNWLSTKSGLSSINVTATAEQLRHETGLGQDFDWIRRKTEKELEKTTVKMITESSSQNITSLKSIFS